MFGITQSREIEDLNAQAINLVKESKLLNFAKMANILIDLFGLDDQFQKIGEREGQEIEMIFPSLEGTLNFTLVSKRENFDCRVGEAGNPVSNIIINVKKEKAIRLVSEIIKLPNNILGLFKIVPKFLLGKIKIKGSFGAALTLCRCMMIGKNHIYKKELYLKGIV